MGIFYMPALIILPLSTGLFIFLVGKKAPSSPGTQRKVLDRAGLIINILLLLFYLPMSLIGSFAGMVGEGYMYGSTPAQSFLCDLIMIVGFCTPLAAYGGLFLSIKFRSQGRSLESFLWQFAGIGWMLIVFLLMAVLFAL